jgi:integrase
VPGTGTGRRNPKMDSRERHFPREILGQTLNLRRPSRQGPSPATESEASSTASWRLSAGILGTPQTCRHTSATHLYRASGADHEIVQEQLGHGSIKTTKI